MKRTSPRPKEDWQSRLDRLSLQFEERALANGLRLILQEDRSLPLVALNLWYHVGSKNERPGKTGLAHLFEHMLFQGSAHVGTNDHFRLVQQVGGVANGSTWYDRTNYYETLPSHQLELGLWLESDRMGFLLPAMTKEKLDTQRKVVLNERRQRVENQPYGRAFERLHELLYPPNHPYHWPVIGYPDDLASVRLRDIEAFFNTHYDPSNAVLTLVGDLDPDSTVDLVERYFGTIPNQARTVEVEAAPHALEEIVREEMPDQVELPRIYLAFPGPPLEEPAWSAGDLLATLLAVGKSSPLYQDLVYRRQIAQDVSAFILPTELESTFVLVATAKPGTSLDTIEDLLDSHLRGLAAEGPHGNDIERARNKTLTALFSELQILDRRADLLSQYATYFGDAGRIRHEIESYLDLDDSDLRSFASRYLTGGRVVLSVVPERGPR